jgi:hypothetical protein
MRKGLSDAGYGQSRDLSGHFQVYRMRYLRKGLSNGHSGGSGELELPLKDPAAAISSQNGIAVAGSYSIALLCK